MATSYKKIGSDWYTCGCGGTPQEVVEVPAGTTPVIFNVFAPSNLQAADNTIYLARPNMICLDVEAVHAQEFFASNKAAEPTSFASNYYKGYFGKQELNY